MRHVPRGAVGAQVEVALKLFRADALLGRAHQMERQDPFVEGNLGPVHDGSDGHGELLPAVIALVEAGTMRLAFQLTDVLEATAVGADRTLGPPDLFEVFPRLFFRQLGRFDHLHGILPVLSLPSTTYKVGNRAGFVKCITPIHDPSVLKKRLQSTLRVYNPAESTVDISEKELREMQGRLESRFNKEQLDKLSAVAADLQRLARRLADRPFLQIMPGATGKDYAPHKDDRGFAVYAIGLEDGAYDVYYQRYIWSQAADEFKPADPETHRIPVRDKAAFRAAF